MRLWLFLKAFAICTAGALLVAALAQDISIALLVRLAAADLGISLLVAMLYPQVRGVKAGDMVLLVSDAGIFSIRTAVALESRHLNEAIRLSLPDGREAYGMVESYAGIITPARARVLVEKQQPQMKIA